MRNFLRRTIYNRSYVLDLLVMALLVTTIYFLVGQRNLTEQLTDVARLNHTLNQQNNDILSRIKSCTDPNGECFKENALRTGEAVDHINELSVLAAACADKPGEQTASEINKCVRSLLKGH